MRASRAISQALVGLVCSAIWLLAAAQTTCRVAYDLGSSGIRAGASNKSGIVRIGLDSLDLLSAPHSAAEAIGRTVAALGELQRKGGFDPECQHLGGGFSAWRLALEKHAVTLAATLGKIQAASGVAIMVIPQTQEGAYGYQGARQMLGDRLVTSHVLDIGGGSLQITGEQGSFGDRLGQKLWQAELCRSLGRAESLPCQLQPMTDEELAAARALLAGRLQGVRTALPDRITMTAVSRPIRRSVKPALLKLALSGVDASGFSLSAVTQAIDKIHGLRLDKVTKATGIAKPYVNYLLSDLLLVEGLLQATDGDSLRVAEVDLTNVPGLLGDERAYAWSKKYSCYLDRLKSLGLSAYATDPASCN